MVRLASGRITSALQHEHHELRGRNIYGFSSPQFYRKIGQSLDRFRIIKKAMLPAFPKIEGLRGRTNHERVMGLAAQVFPILGMIDRHVQFEGRDATIIRHDHTIGHSPLHAVTSEIRFPPLSLVKFTDEELLKQLEILAEQLARGVAEQFHAEMEKAVTAVGNVVDAGGQPLSEELMLKMIEKMEHSFEPDGRWIPPTLLASPELIDRLKASGSSECSGSKEFNQALKTILEKKLDDFRRREADRVLAG